MSQPHLSAWAEDGRPLRLVDQTVATSDPDPKALACYGLLREHDGRPDQMWLRFVDGRPMSAVTIQFLAWCADRLAAVGKTALLVVWDNASWHISRTVRTWVRAHNQPVKRQDGGVRLLVCCLPVKSPWLNPIEPKWTHGKRHVVEPDQLLPAHELADRVCASFACAHEPHLTLPEQVT